MPATHSRWTQMVLGSVLCLALLCCASTLQASAQSTTGKKFHPAEARILGKLVYTDITAEFTNIELRQVMEFFSTATDITLTIRWMNDKSLTGLDPELPITMRINQQPALNALQMILDECSEESGEECTWQLYQGLLEVGTKDWLGRSSAQYLKQYDVENLLFEVPDFDNAPTLDLGNFGGGGGGLGGGGRGGGGGIGGGGGGFGGGRGG
ncbi:MAG: hypothetical protein MK095_09630, partial [Phycisphaerales bacterium]|nr:hypothetical protein [Phycisphaerales bacterium]